MIAQFAKRQITREDHLEAHVTEPGLVAAGELESKRDAMPATQYGNVSWERMIRAVEKVRDRLLRATAALNKAGVPYAVAGGNAVAAGVSRMDEAAVRNTQDADILLRRSDLPAATTALSAAGFIYRHVKSLDIFWTARTPAREMPCMLFSPERKFALRIRQPRRMFPNQKKQTRSAW